MRRNVAHAAVFVLVLQILVFLSCPRLVEAADKDAVVDLKAFFDGIPVEIAPHTDLVITSLGNGIGQTTSVERQSGASEGPNSFLVHRDGTVYVLDQLNRRVQIFKDGNAIGVVPIPSPTIEEVYPDAKYHDTCISEIQFFLESGLIPLVVQKR